jgi:hypothetical protein
MGLADIASIPTTPAELKKWSFCHQVAHFDINRRIQEKFQIVIPMFILDPMNPDDLDLWSYQHQLVHSNMDAVLGISGNDLLGLDINDRGILQAWLFLHLPEHLQAAAKLGL